MNILYINILNNYSGSPKVLSNILGELSLYKKYNISLLTSNTDGCLSGISNITYYYNHYKWSINKYKLIFRIFISQLYMFYFVIMKMKNMDIIYINTVFPFLPAIAAKIRNKKILYHVHEVYARPNLLHRFMWLVMEICASKIISVSQYVSESIKRKSVVIYNAVSREQEVSARKMLTSDIFKQKYSHKTILMVSSLNKKKGIDVFVSLAKKMPDYSFNLLISSPHFMINQYFSGENLPSNLHLISEQRNMDLFYFQASILINLSLPHLWIETFGMTLLEGMHFGTPCIAPNFGGPKEIIKNGKNGILIDPYDESSIITAINIILHSEDEYKNFVENSLCLKDRFLLDLMTFSIMNELNSLYTEE